MTQYTKSKGDKKMRHFEYKDTASNSNKFWKIGIKGKLVTVNFGRIGNKAQEKVFNKIKNEADAKKFFEKKIREKMNKGYVEIN